MDAFHIEAEETSQYRIAMISDGFPHYVHLLTEKLLWQMFEDTKTFTKTTPRHYTAAVRAAVTDIEPHLKQMYEKASLKYKADYETVLWAVADHYELKRRGMPASWCCFGILAASGCCRLLPRLLVDMFCAGIASMNNCANCGYLMKDTGFSRHFRPHASHTKEVGP
jgi:hypothetical protein